jgi:hypothetical protein
VEKRVKVAPADLTGTFTQFVNAALTTVLGAWMGLNGILGIVLTSKPLFQVVIVGSLVVGCVVGIHNYRFTKRAIQKQLEKRKLQDIQLSIFDFLNEKRLEEINAKTKEIDQLLHEIKVGKQHPLHQSEIPPFSFYLGEFKQIEQQIQNRYEKDPHIYSLFTKEFSMLQERIGQNLPSSHKKNIPPILQPLIEAPLPKDPHKKSWIRTNWRHLLISSIPVLYGTLTSLFGASGNAKIIACQVKWTEMYAFLNNSYVQRCGIFLAIAITLYFTFSFIIKNRMQWRRDREIDKAREQIIEHQATLSKRDDQILKLKEMLILAERIFGIYKIIEKGGDRWNHING